MSNRNGGTTHKIPSKDSQNESQERQEERERDGETRSV